MRVLVTGAQGMLAQAVTHEFQSRGHEVHPLGRAELDVSKPQLVDAVVRRIRPDAVIQCAAYTQVDLAEADEGAAHLINATATTYLAAACREVGARLVYPSTDYVFDGQATEPYHPDAPTAPINAYGRTKLAGEVAARGAGESIVVRTSWLYGAGGRNFVATILERARRGDPLRVVNDQTGSPTWTGTLAWVIAELLRRGAPAGTYHATNLGETTWYELAVESARIAGVEARIEPVPSSEFPTPARRPAYSVLDSSATAEIVGGIAGWRDALAEAVRGL